MKGKIVKVLGREYVDTEQGDESPDAPQTDLPEMRQGTARRPGKEGAGD